MTSLTFATLLLHVSIVAAEDDSYAKAHSQAEKGKPMVILVSADWCSPCQEMKKNVIPQVKRSGLLKKVAFAIVNVDRQRSLARKLIGGGAIPQLIMYRKTTHGWKRRKLIGGQTAKAVEKFIDEGIAMAESEKTAPKHDGSPKKAVKETAIRPVSRH